MCESKTLHAPLCPPPQCLFTVTCPSSVSISVTGSGQVVFDWPLERILKQWRCQGSQGECLPQGGGGGGGGGSVWGVGGVHQSPGALFLGIREENGHVSSSHFPQSSLSLLSSLFVPCCVSIFGSMIFCLSEIKSQQTCLQLYKLVLRRSPARDKCCHPSVKHVSVLTF